MTLGLSLEMKWRRPELVSENEQFLLWKRTVFTLEKKLEVLKELDKGLSQRLVGERYVSNLQGVSSVLSYGHI